MLRPVPRDHALKRDDADAYQGKEGQKSGGVPQEVQLRTGRKWRLLESPVTCQPEDGQNKGRDEPAEVASPEFSNHSRSTRRKNGYRRSADNASAVRAMAITKTAKASAALIFMSRKSTAIPDAVNNCTTQKDH